MDKQLAEYIVEEHKPAIFVMNKWDLVKENIATEKMADYVRAIDAQAPTAKAIPPIRGTGCS